MGKMRHDVIIIGGGISGITTALYCIDAGYRVILLEKTKRFGGRIQTIHHGNIAYEAGASRINITHKRIMALAKRFKLTLNHTPSTFTFRDTSTSKTYANYTNTIDDVIQQTIDYANMHFTHNQLRKINFHCLCVKAIGDEATKRLMDSCGFTSHFTLLNAYDGIATFSNEKNGKYYHIKEGFSELIDRMVVALKNSPMATLLLDQTVTGWSKDKTSGTMNVIAVDNATNAPYVYEGASIVCTLPKKDLLKTFKWSKLQRELLDSVSPVPLHRIYGRFPTSNGKPWFANVKRTVITDNPIRQFVPISYENGLAMVSYSDDKNADMWKKQITLGEKELRDKLLSNIHIVFPNVSNIPNPYWIQSHYWESGMHTWKPSVDSHATRHQLLQPYGEKLPWFLVGDAYSENQAWIEGALETVDDMIPRLFENLNHQRVKRSFGGTGNKAFEKWLRNKGRMVTWADLDMIKKEFPDIKWVMLRDPLDKKLKIINVTEWMFEHPGGASVFQDYLYQNITTHFESVVSHRDANGKINPIVLGKIKEHTVATFA